MEAVNNTGEHPRRLVSFGIIKELHKTFNMETSYG